MDQKQIEEIVRSVMASMGQAAPAPSEVWGSDQFWAELVQPGRTSKPCVARGVVI